MQTAGTPGFAPVSLPTAYCLPPTLPVFLDRDGVLIRTFVREGVPHPPDDVAAVEILPGVAAALRRLREYGFRLLVVTNQPDVARGTQSRERVERINELLLRWLPLNGIYTCYHDAADRCLCRKPAPGLILAAAGEHGVDPSRGFLVGDRWSDVAAGRAAGCRTLLIERPYSAAERCSPDVRVADLPEAAEWILPAATAGALRPHRTRSGPAPDVPIALARKP